MKKGYIIFTALFVVGIMVMTGGSAMAAAGFWTNAGTKTVIIGGNTASMTSAATVTSPTFNVGDAETLSSGDYFTITLTGGAVFNGTPVVAVVNNASGTAINLLSGGTAGSTTAKFRVGTGTTIATPGGIQFVTTGTAISSLLNVTALAHGSNVDFLATLENSAGGALISGKSLYSTNTATGYPFVGQSLLTVTNTYKEDSADVSAASGPYTKFEGNLTTGTATVLTFLSPVAGETTSYPIAGLAKNKLLITLTGDFTGITKVAGGSSTMGITGSDSAGSITGGLSGQFLINAAKTAAYAVNTDALVGQGTTAIGINPQFTIDGTTAQTERSFTAKIENLVDSSNYNANTWLSPGTNYKILRNGVYFSANSLGTYNTVKISDINGKIPATGAIVYISAWDAAGTKLADAAGAVAIVLQANQTITLTGDAIAARFVGTPMKYEFAVQDTSAVVTNVKKTPEGFGSNVYKAGGGGGI
jgi:hypothetical protein